MTDLGKARSTWVAASGTVAVLLAGACTSGDGTEATASDAPTAAQTAAQSSGAMAGEIVSVTVGVIPILDVAPLYLAVEQGFFAESGLEVAIETASGGSAIVPGVLSGEYEFGFSNNTSLLLATSNGVGLDIVAAGASSTGAEGEDFGAIVALEDSGITGPADLAGRRVAVNALNNIGDTTTRNAVREAGGDATDIHFVEIPFPAATDALLSGAVDAAFVVEPFLTIAEEAGAEPVSWLFATAGEDLSVATYFTSDDFTEQRPDVVARFADALRQGSEYAGANPDEVRRIVTSYTSIEAGLAAEIRLPAFPIDVNGESIRRLDELARTDRVYTRPPNVDELL